MLALCFIVDESRVTCSVISLADYTTLAAAQLLVDLRDDCVGKTGVCAQL